MTALGVHAAQSSDDLPLAWFLALTQTPEQAAELMADVNGDRQMSRVKARIGWPSS